MNLLFLGPVCPADKIGDIRRISKHFSPSANVLELALIDGFDNYADVTIESSLKIVSDLFFVPEYRFHHKEGASSNYDLLLSHYRFPFFDQLFNGRRKYRNIIRQGLVPDLIVVYSIRLEDLKAAYLIKKKYPKAVVLVVVTDLPQYMRDNPSRFYKGLKKIETNRCFSLMRRCVDGFVLLSDYMKEQLPIEDKPYIVMEGIYHPEDEIMPQTEKSNVKAIMYSGNLDSRYGMSDLLDAFSIIKDTNYELWLCGNGNTVPRIKEMSEHDPRIKFFGILPRAKVLEMQKNATLLVNPRHSTEKFTKYSFPSKTMEYMASGTPTLMSPLLSLPEEYRKHVYLFDDESVEGMSKTIQSICGKTPEELSDFGRSASVFIFANKTADKQCKRIIEFAISINN